MAIQCGRGSEGDRHVGARVRCSDDPLWHGRVRPELRLVVHGLRFEKDGRHTCDFRSSSAAAGGPSRDDGRYRGAATSGTARRPAGHTDRSAAEQGVVAKWNPGLVRWWQQPHVFERRLHSDMRREQHVRCDLLWRLLHPDLPGRIDLLAHLLGRWLQANLRRGKPLHEELHRKRLHLTSRRAGRSSWRLA